MDVVDGLWLEDRRVRLTWGATLASLRARTRPDFVVVRNAEDSHRTILSWKDRVWNGLPCQITTEFGSNLWLQRSLRGIRLVLHYPPDVRTIQDGFAWSRRVVASRFGQPQTTHDDGEQGKSLWQFGDVTIRDQYYDGYGGSHEVLLFLSEDRS